MQEISVDPPSALLILKLIRSWSGFITQLLISPEALTANYVHDSWEGKNNQYAHKTYNAKAILQVMLLTQKHEAEFKCVSKIEPMSMQENNKYIEDDFGKFFSKPKSS